MADTDPRPDKEWLDRQIQEWLNTHWTAEPDCPVCGENAWTASDRILEMRPFHRGSLKVGGGGLVPMVALVCSNCGNTLFFNAIVMGLIDMPEPKPEGEKQPEPELSEADDAENTEEPES